MAKDRVRNVEELLCARCNVTTAHTVRGAHDTSWGDDEVWGGAEHDLLSCNGCNSVTYRKSSWFSEEPGESAVTLLPPRGEAVRSIKEFEQLDYRNPVSSVYHQTVTAYNQQLSTLAGAGMRLVLEGVCKDRGIDDGPVTNSKGATTRKDNLEGKINGLVEHGLISAQQADILHEIRFLGNDAAHELDQPSSKVLTVALEIVEHILAQAYQHPEHAKTLANRQRPTKT